MYLKNNKWYDICTWLLACYVIILLCITVVLRELKDNPTIHRDLFWSYHRSRFPFMTIDSEYNILLYIPIGIMVCLLTTKYKLIKVLFWGFLLSETIESLQLIFRKGVFDVDDLFSNTLGAFVGGFLTVVVLWIVRKVKMKNI